MRPEHCERETSHLRQRPQYDDRQDTQEDED